MEYLSIIPEMSGGQPAAIVVDSGDNSMGDDIDHDSAQLCDRLAALHDHDSARDADVVFLVAGERLPAHRLLLAMHNDYFRTLLCSASFRESAQSEIELADCPSAEAFRALLRYVYSGRMPLAGLPIDGLVLDVLALAHRFGFAALVLAIAQHLQKGLAVGNVCAIVGVARLYGLDELHEACLQSMDRNAEPLLLEADFRALPSDMLCALLRRDSFYAPEVKIFGAVREWTEANAATVGADVVAEAMSLVRLNLIDVEQLLDVVRPTGFYSPDRILDVVKEITTVKNKPSHRRSAMWPDRIAAESREIRGPAMLPGRNVASPEYGAQVEGIAGTHNLLDNDGETTEEGYLSHPISDANAEGIVVELGTVYIINHVKLLLWDLDRRRTYRYYVEVSVDRKRWQRCVDHTKYACRSWQWLYFPARPVKYVRLVGTGCSANTTFPVVSLQASYVERPEPVRDGFVAPQCNVATVERGAVVTVGSDVDNVLINGDFTTYTAHTGFTYHIIGENVIGIQLGQPCWLESMRMLLWDLNPKLNSFYVQTSTDGQTWRMAVDRRNERVKSWQSWTMESRLVIYVRIVGTFRELNVFPVVHFECPSQVPIQK